jgi:hypothetical protein
MKSNLIDLPAELRAETPLAWLISTDGTNRVWIPKSQAEFEDGVLTLPEPLALEKKLI